MRQTPVAPATESSGDMTKMLNQQGISGQVTEFHQDVEFEGDSWEPAVHSTRVHDELVQQVANKKQKPTRSNKALKDSTDIPDFEEPSSETFDVVRLYRHWQVKKLDDTERRHKKGAEMSNGLHAVMIEPKISSSWAPGGSQPEISVASVARAMNDDLITNGSRTQIRFAIAGSR